MMDNFPGLRVIKLFPHIYIDHVERIYPYIFKETEHTQNPPCRFDMPKY